MKSEVRELLREAPERMWNFCNKWVNCWQMIYFIDFHLHQPHHDWWYSNYHSPETVWQTGKIQWYLSPESVIQPWQSMFHKSEIVHLRQIKSLQIWRYFCKAWGARRGRETGQFSELIISIREGSRWKQFNKQEVETNYRRASGHWTLLSPYWAVIRLLSNATIQSAPVSSIEKSNSISVQSVFIYSDRFLPFMCKVSVGGY